MGAVEGAAGVDVAVLAVFVVALDPLESDVAVLGLCVELEDAAGFGLE